MSKRRKRKHSSRPIVSGYLEKVSANIFDSFKEEIISVIAGHQGVYALYRKNKLYYVGLATDLKNRISHHLLDRHQGKWTHFSLYMIRREEHTRELESLLLRIAYPAGNSIRGKLRTINLLPKLKVQVKEKIRQEYEDLFKGYKLFDRKKRKHRRKHNSKDHLAERPLKGLLKGYQRIYCTYKGKDHRAKVLPNGVVELIPSKKHFDSPSMAGIAVIKKKTINGWKLWKYKGKTGELVYIDSLRK